MPGLCFKFRDLINETKALKTIAEDFLDPATTWVLDDLKNSLESMSSAGQDQERRIELQPLQTKPSEGAYEPGDRQGGSSICAVITGKWDIRSLGDNSRKARAKDNRWLEFCGIASTEVELRNVEAPERPIAKWKMDLGAEDAPGCYFHVHILGDVPIPRLPSIFITPMGAIEYVLGELFQGGWEKAVNRSHGDFAYWHGLQQKRLLWILNWYQDKLKNLNSSPWMTLKAAKPDGEMVL